MAFSRDTFVIYDEEYHSGAVEEIQRAAFDLNSAAGGVMRMSTQNMRGEFLKETFFKDIEGLIRDRDPNDLTDSTPDDILMGEEISVKIHKSLHVEKTLNSFKALGQDPQTMSFVVGAIQGKRMVVDYMDTAIASVTAALLAESATTLYDATAVSGKETISPANLNRIKKRLGDQSQRVRGWVMDSTMYHDLVEENITEKLFEVAGRVVYGGSPATLGLPVIVTDSPYLMVEGTPADPGDPGAEPPVPPTPATADVHYVLALTEGSVEVVEAEDRAVLSEVVGGKKNLVGRIQSEYALMTKVAGYAYTGAQHPTVADLADTANWERVVASVKSGPGAIGQFWAIEEA